MFPLFRLQDDQYDADVETAIGAARRWFSAQAPAELGPPSRDQLVVFDIDETALCNIKVCRISRDRLTALPTEILPACIQPAIDKTAALA